MSEFVAAPPPHEFFRIGRAQRPLSFFRIPVDDAVQPREASLQAEATGSRVFEAVRFTISGDTSAKIILRGCRAQLSPKIQTAWRRLRYM